MLCARAKSAWKSAVANHLKRLMVSGGGSQSDEIMQITADVFGMPVERPHTYETSALGAAIAAAVGSGIHPDFATAVESMTHQW